MFDLLIGKQINNYQIEQELGGGGMGVVYRATDTLLDIPVTIKVMRPEYVSRSEFQQRFLQEARTAAKLSDHQSIIKILKFDEEQDFFYMVMEYVAGGSLGYHLRGVSSSKMLFDLKESLFALCQVAEALAYAHRQGVVHRDVKPDNILMRELETPIRPNEPLLKAIVTDFGLAKLLEGGQVKTQQGMVMGTYAYMSPEQMLGKPLNGKSDIYSLGIVLYQMVTGRLPFIANSLSDAYRMHTEEIPPPPTDFRRKTPPAVVKILEKALAKNPSDRFATADGMAKALRHVAAKLPSDNTTVSLLAQVQSVSRAPVEVAQQPVIDFSGDQLFIAQRDQPRRIFPLGKEIISIGRTDDNDLALPADKVSRRHARLEKQRGRWRLIDLASTNGTIYNGNRLLPDAPQEWAPNGKVRIGPFWLQLRLAREEKIQRKEEQIDDFSFAPMPRPEDSFIGEGIIEEIKHEKVLELNMEQPFVSVLPGSPVMVQLNLINRTEIVGHYEIDVEEIPNKWVHIQRNKIRLMPNGNDTMMLKIQPDRVYSTLAGDQVYRVVAKNVQDGMEVAACEGRLHIQDFEQVSAELMPKRIDNGKTCRLIINNEGNDSADLTIYARDPAEEIDFSGNGRTLTIEPGEETYQTIEVNARRRPWFGSPQTKTFDISVESNNGMVQQDSGTIIVKPRIAKWMLMIGGLTFFLTCLLGMTLAARLSQIDSQDAQATASATAAIAFAVTEEFNQSERTRVALENTQSAEAFAATISFQETRSALTTEAGEQKRDNEATQAAEKQEQDKAEAEQTTEAMVQSLTGEAFNNQATEAAEKAIAAGDNDKDGLSNDEEASAGTDENKSDTDGDGLSDFVELRQYGTNPLVKDTDGDGADDGKEVNTLKTLPLVVDSDGDGVPDGNDPSPNSTPVPATNPGQPPVNPPGGGGSAGGGSTGGGSAGGGSAGGGGGANLNGSPTGPNLLNNGSFENGHYNQNNVQELQMPVGWKIAFIEGANPFGTTYFRPETGVLDASRLNKAQNEDKLFVWDGNFTLKMFKDGPMSAQVFSDTVLPAGAYELTVNFYPDIVVEYNNGRKVFATDPSAAQVRLLGSTPSEWLEVKYGQQNTLTHRFIVSSSGSVRIGLDTRAIFQYNNNGWFMDAFTLKALK